MTRTDADLLKTYAGRGVLLDANLLLLLVIGTCDRKLVRTYKRLSIFAEEDFDLLALVVSAFRHLYVTPNIITEVSNLAGALSGDVKRQCFRTLAESIRASEELIVSSRDASNNEMFVEFGVTDAVINICAGEPPLVLTVDFPLAQTLASRGRPVVNFNHLRYTYWQ
ncbi:MAG TPA: hypothetical protein VMU84_17640 [Thermoanaerobaculia bacterium]|nr:hypothetical protein [Thermoanaerobaculia bacterium]